MQKISKISLCLSLLVSSNAILAAMPMPNSFYAGVHSGAAFPGGQDSGDINTGYLVGGDLGYRFDRVRVEGEAAFVRNSFKDDTSSYFNTLLYMANAYYDIQLSDMLAPYVGSGVGLAQGWASGAGLDTSTQNEFAYQFMGGLAVNITPAVALTFQYRYVGITSSPSSAINALEAGLNYTFSV
jgi:opacity protein-like surface antigen